jgi:phage/plasmid-like protein (TIGR03299 family)
MSALVETMAYAGEVPWHGLGTKVPHDLAPAQMLRSAGLDWTVNKVPAFIEVDSIKVNTGTQALIRSTDNSILTMVSDNWNPVQNEEAFEFFHDFVASGDMQMHTAGSLREGKVVWGLAKVNDGFELFGGDNVESFLLFTNPHEFGRSIDIRFTPIRVVCNNTLTLALGSKSDYQIKLSHRRAFDPDTAKTALGIAKEKLDQYKQMAEFLGSKRFKKDSLKDYFNIVFPRTTAKENKELSRNAALAMSVLELQPGSKYAEGSWWQPFNAVTFLVDHKLGRNPDNRLYNSWYGLTRNTKLKALETAVEFAEAA